MAQPEHFDGVGPPAARDQDDQLEYWRRIRYPNDRIMAGSMPPADNLTADKTARQARDRVSERYTIRTVQSGRRMPTWARQRRFRRAVTPGLSSETAPTRVTAVPSTVDKPPASAIDEALAVSLWVIHAEPITPARPGVHR
jgi:hypothetical protein